MAIRLTGIASGLDTDSMVQELVSAYSLKKENYEKQKTKLEWKKEAWKDMNTDIYGFYTGALSNLRRTSSFLNKKSCTVSDTTKVSVTAGANVAYGAQTIKISQLAKAAYLTGSAITKSDGTEITDVTGTKMSELGVATDSVIKVKDASGNITEVTMSADETISEFTVRFKEETGLSATFDVGQQRFIFNSESGEKNDFSFVAEDETDLNVLSGLGLATADNYTALGETVPATVAYQQEATDSIIVVNGATYKTDSNKLVVNGLTINALSESETITVTTSQDTDGIYNMVKEFISGYNEVINKMTSKYNAATAKGYEPLTDDEKDSMSEKEIEKWEQKIKDSLLRRDSTLNTVMSSMIANMGQGVEIDGKTYHLSDFGIKTGGYLTSKENEQNAYHIDGDADDSESGDADDKLRAMIESDPELVTKFFTKLSTSVYDDLTKKMSSTKLSSAFTIYNDKQMDDELKDLEDKIDEWEERITDYEDYWYDKFSAMEKALSELQSQTNQLTALLGS